MAKKRQLNKNRKGFLKKINYKSNILKFGVYGIKAAQSGILHSRQIEAVRKSISRKMEKKCKIWIRIYPSVSITKKPIGTRMGKGKGQIKDWIIKISAGTTLFEVCGVEKTNSIMEILKLSSQKLPLKTKIFS